MLIRGTTASVSRVRPNRSGHRSHRQVAPLNVTTSTVSLNVHDVAASSAFLRTHFGFAERMAADGFASLGRDDAALDIVLLRRGSGILPEEQRDQHAAGLIIALTVADLAAEDERLRGEGSNITMPLREEPWGERLLGVTDPDGVVIQLVEWVTPAGARAGRDGQRRPPHGCTTRPAVRPRSSTPRGRRGCGRPRRLRRGSSRPSRRDSGHVPVPYAWSSAGAGACLTRGKESRGASPSRR